MPENVIESDEKEAQIQKMREWFYSSYERPEENTPYEGGFIYIWGGPFYAEEELHSAFGDEFAEEVINELVGELESESSEWAGIPGPEDFDDYTFNAIISNTEFHGTFTSNMQVVKHLLENEISEDIANNYYMLLYANIITSLETYLSDAFINTVLNDKSLLRKFVEKNPELSKEKISVSDLFNQLDIIDQKVKKYLLDLMWHNLGKIMPMYQATLDITFPNEMSEIFRAITQRHDIVHRNGKTKTGDNITIKKDKVAQLIDAVSTLVKHIDDQLPT